MAYRAIQEGIVLLCLTRRLDGSGSWAVDCRRVGRPVALVGNCEGVAEEVGFRLALLQDGLVNGGPEKCPRLLGP